MPKKKIIPPPAPNEPGADRSRRTSTAQHTTASISLSKQAKEPPPKPSLPPKAPAKRPAPAAAAAPPAKKAAAAASAGSSSSGKKAVVASPASVVASESESPGRPTQLNADINPSCIPFPDTERADVGVVLAAEPASRAARLPAVEEQEEDDGGDEPEVEEVE